MTSLPSVQRLHTRLRAIDDDTLVLADGQPRAIFEVFPGDVTLADDEELEAHTARLAALLHGLTFPIQVLLCLIPPDLEAHAREVEAASADRGSRIAAAGRDYASLARHLDRTGSLLEPHLYVVVGLDGTRGSLLQQLLDALPWMGRRRVPGPTDSELLDARAEQVALLLDHAGAAPVRLNDVEVALLLYRCWCPERARTEPLRIQPAPIGRRLELAEGVA
jgi:hypothetical protein